MAKRHNPRGHRSGHVVKEVEAIAKALLYLQQVAGGLGLDYLSQQIGVAANITGDYLSFFRRSPTARRNDNEK